MNEKTKDTVTAVTKVAFPTLGALSLLGIVVAGGGVCIGSLLAMLLFYEPVFFGMTFSGGFLAAVLGTWQLSKKFFELS